MKEDKKLTFCNSSANAWPTAEPKGFPNKLREDKEVLCLRASIILNPVASPI
jgi:hypothetical protein